MTIIGTTEEIKLIKQKCDGRCIDGEWCVFSEFAENGVCPVDGDIDCLAIETINVKGFNVSSLNQR